MKNGEMENGWMDQNVVKKTEWMGNGRLVGVEGAMVGPPGRLDTSLPLDEEVETAMCVLHTVRCL